jgi:hypothetical protein
MRPTVPGDGNNFVVLTSSLDRRQEIVQNDASG